jgi:hypothetical protein
MQKRYGSDSLIGLLKVGYFQAVQATPTIVFGDRVKRAKALMISVLVAEQVFLHFAHGIARE